MVGILFPSTEFVTWFTDFRSLQNFKISGNDDRFRYDVWNFGIIYAIQVWVDEKFAFVSTYWQESSFSFNVMKLAVILSVL